LSVDELIKSMDKNNISKAVICPLGKGLVVQNAKTNEEIATAVKKFPDRLVGFAGANPWQEDEAVDELERAVKDLGLRGLKLHPDIQGFPASDELAYPLVKRAGELKVPVYVHSGTSPNSQPMEIGELAGACPETNVIMGHMGYDNYYSDAVPAARQFENLLLETSRNTQYWTIQDAVNAIGADRVIFGTDQPYSRPEVEITSIKSVELQPESLEKILAGNIIRILERL
jgi:predicted TIM-barrel fold metal-dependent hydrolase